MPTNDEVRAAPGGRRKNPRTQFLIFKETSNSWARASGTTSEDLTKHPVVPALYNLARAPRCCRNGSR